MWCSSWPRLMHQVEKRCVGSEWLQTTYGGIKQMVDTLFPLLYVYRCFFLANQACTFMKQTGLGVDWRIRRQHLQPARVATSAFLPKKQVVQQEAFYGILWSSAQCEKGNASWQALDFVSPVHSMFGYVDGLCSQHYIYTHQKHIATSQQHNNARYRSCLSLFLS